MKSFKSIILFFYFSTITIYSNSQAGTLDNTFGTGGKVFSNFGVNSQTHFRAMVIQSDGKIILGGSNRIHLTSDLNPTYAMVRFNINGTIDNTFGTNGLVEVDFGDDLYSEIVQLALQSDGKIIAVGNRGMLRFSTNGTLDLNFGLPNISGWPWVSQTGIRSLVVLPDNKIIKAGDGYSVGSGSFDFYKFSSDGIPDASYGSSFTAAASFSVGPSTAAGNSVARLAKALLQSDGNIICAGHYIYQPDGSMEQIAVFRILANGQNYDNTFTPIGGDFYGETLIFTQNDLLYDAKLLPDGKIIVIGETANNNGSNQAMIIAKINSNGTLDPSFGINGKTTFSTTIAYEKPFSLDIQSDGKIIITSIHPTSQGSFNLIRLNANGTFDNSFGTNGVISGSFGLTYYEINGNLVKIQPDGKILVAGTGISTVSAPYPCMAIARYLPGTLASISENNNLQNEISLFPNPTSENITVTSDNEVIKSIIITDATGIKVQQIELNTLSTNLNLKDLSSGIYFLQINTNSSTISKRVLKN